MSMSNGYKCHQPGYTILHWMICLWHSWHSWHCTLVFQISFWFTRLLQTNLQTSGWHSLTKRVMLQVSGKVTKNSCWMYCSYHVRALPLEKRPVIWIYIYTTIYIYSYLFIYLFIHLYAPIPTWTNPMSRVSNISWGGTAVLSPSNAGLAWCGSGRLWPFVSVGSNDRTLEHDGKALKI